MKLSLSKESMKFNSFILALEIEAGLKLPYKIILQRKINGMYIARKQNMPSFKYNH